MTDLEFERFLCSYLTAENARDVISCLRSFPDNVHRLYSLPANPRQYFLQGDCYENLPAARLKMVEGSLASDVVTFKGVILNNSCDMSEERKGGDKVDLMFCPLISLRKYVEQLFSKKDKTQNQVSEIIRGIKSQEYSHIMYFPPTSDVDDEGYMVRFDRIFSCNIGFVRQLQPKTFFTLSNYGFYAFLYKMSVHFLRMREKEDRGNASSLATKEE